MVVGSAAGSCCCRCCLVGRGVQGPAALSLSPHPRLAREPSPDTPACVMLCCASRCARRAGAWPARSRAARPPQLRNILVIAAAARPIDSRVSAARSEAEAAGRPKRGRTNGGTLEKQNSKDGDDDGRVGGTRPRAGKRAAPPGAHSAAQPGRGGRGVGWAVCTCRCCAGAPGGSQQREPAAEGPDIPWPPPRPNVVHTSAVLWLAAHPCPFSPHLAFPAPLPCCSPQLGAHAGERSSRSVQKSSCVCGGCPPLTCCVLEVGCRCVWRSCWGAGSIVWVSVGTGLSTQGRSLQVPGQGGGHGWKQNNGQTEYTYMARDETPYGRIYGSAVFSVKLRGELRSAAASGYIYIHIYRPGFGSRCQLHLEAPHNTTCAAKAAATREAHVPPHLRLGCSLV